MIGQLGMRSRRFGRVPPSVSRLVSCYGIVSCYSPRWSWPWRHHHQNHRLQTTSSSHLDSTWVTVPWEDGLATARVGLDPALNRFHAPLIYHENYSFDGWPENHTFRMNKFVKTAQALLTTCQATIPSSNLPRPLVQDTSHFFRPIPVQDIPLEWICGPTDRTFFERFCSGQLSVEECRRIGFREQTSRPELIQRTLLEVAGTILACQLAVRYGIASNVAGGTHHAHPTGGAGYTILNDLALASHVLTSPELLSPWTKSTVTAGSVASAKPIRTVLVIDCDVHQGDGTARFGASGQPLHGKLFTLSLHCASNYPQPKAQSTWDVGLPDGIGDDEYLAILQSSVEHALEQIHPDLCLYDAGVDVFQHDRLGRLNLSEAGIRKRDRWVLQRCVEAGIPVAAVIGGGYDSDLDALARRHAIVHEECGYVWRKFQMWKRGR